MPDLLTELQCVIKTTLFQDFVNEIAIVAHKNNGDIDLAHDHCLLNNN